MVWKSTPKIEDKKLPLPSEMTLKISPVWLHATYYPQNS